MTCFLQKLASSSEAFVSGFRDGLPSLRNLTKSCHRIKYKETRRDTVMIFENGHEPTLTDEITQEGHGDSFRPNTCQITIDRIHRLRRVSRPMYSKVSRNLIDPFIRLIHWVPDVLGQFFLKANFIDICRCIPNRLPSNGPGNGETDSSNI